MLSKLEGWVGFFSSEWKIGRLYTKILLLVVESNILCANYCQPQPQGFQVATNQGTYQGNTFPKVSRSFWNHQGSRKGQGPRINDQNQKDNKGLGYVGIPPLVGTINMILGGMHVGGQNAHGHKAYARQVMTLNKNRPLKCPFEEAKWENTPIMFSLIDYKRQLTRKYRNYYRSVSSGKSNIQIRCPTLCSLRNLTANGEYV